MKRKQKDEKRRTENNRNHRHQPELSIFCLSPQHLAQLAGHQTGEFQPSIWEQRDMMTSLHKTVQSLLKPTQPHSFSSVQPSHKCTASKQ